MKEKIREIKTLVRIRRLKEFRNIYVGGAESMLFLVALSGRWDMDGTID